MTDAKEQELAEAWDGAVRKWDEAYRNEADREWAEACRKRIRLWTALVWHEWEPAPCEIPDPYRSHYRFDAAEAWDIAKIIHPPNAKGETSNEG